MPFTTVPDRASGYALQASDWNDYIKDNMNSGTWVVLANSTLTGSAADIDFTSISGSFAHLILMAYLREDRAQVSGEVRVRFNGDTGANYDRQRVGGFGGSSTASESFAATSAKVGEAPAANAGANLFGSLTLMAE